MNTLEPNVKMEQANTILQQLGGARFQIMTGANSFMAVEGGLQFRIPRAKDTINCVSIKLNRNDLYDLQFMTIWGLKVTTKNVATDVGSEQLEQVFSKVTGLATRL